MTTPTRFSNLRGEYQRELARLSAAMLSNGTGADAGVAELSDDMNRRLQQLVDSHLRIGGLLKQLEELPTSFRDRALRRFIDAQEDPSLSLEHAWVAVLVESLGDAAYDVVDELVVQRAPEGAEPFGVRAQALARHLEAKRWTSAADELDAWLEGEIFGTEPGEENNTLVLLAARVAVARGEIDTAERYFNELSDGAADKAEHLLLKARIERVRGAIEAADNYVAAATHSGADDLLIVAEHTQLEALFGTTSSTVASSFQVAEAEVAAVGSIAEGVRRLRSRLEPTPPQVWAGLLSRAVIEDEPELAAEALAEARDACDTDGEARAEVEERAIGLAALSGEATESRQLVEAARHRQLAGDMTWARSLFRTAINLDSTNRDAIFEFADAVQSDYRGETQAVYEEIVFGVEQLERVLADGVDDQDSWALLALSLLHERASSFAIPEWWDHTWGALRAAAVGVVAAPREALRWDRLGHVLNDVWLQGVAVFATEITHKIEPNPPPESPLFFGAARSLVNFGQSTEAEEYLEAMPDAYGPNEIRGVIANQSGDHERAVELLLDVENREPYGWSAFISSMAATDDSRLDSYLEQFPPALANHDLSFAWLDIHIRVLMLQGRLGEAAGLADQHDVVRRSSEPPLGDDLKNAIAVLQGNETRLTELAPGKLVAPGSVLGRVHSFNPIVTAAANRQGMTIEMVSPTLEDAQEQIDDLQARQSPDIDIQALRATVTLTPENETIIDLVEALVALARGDAAPITELGQNGTMPELAFTSARVATLDSAAAWLADGCPARLSQSNSVETTEDAPVLDWQLSLPFSWLADHDDPASSHPLMTRVIPNVRAALGLPPLRVQGVEDWQYGQYEVAHQGVDVETGPLQRTDWWVPADSALGARGTEPDHDVGEVAGWRSVPQTALDPRDRLFAFDAFEFVVYRASKLSAAEAEPVQADDGNPAQIVQRVVDGARRFWREVTGDSAD